METSTIEIKNCEKIATSFELSNVHGFIPLFTRVYLETPNGKSTEKPIAVTPPLNTNASIIKTSPFNHYHGLLYYETFLNYKNVDASDLDELIKRLQFSYKVYDCKDKVIEIKEYDNFKKIDSKKLLYFTKIIDIL